jgi:cell division protease FtsH
MADKTPTPLTGQDNSRPKTPIPPLPSGSDSPPGVSPGPTRINPFSWFLLAALFAWNIWAFMPRPNPPVTLPYSEFVTQVAKGNVSKVLIVGEAISGVLAHAIAWPEPALTPTPPSNHSKPAAVQAAPAQPEAVTGAEAAHETQTRPNAVSSQHVEPLKSAESAKSAAAPMRTESHPSAPPKTPPPPTYTRFRTTFPGLVGDASLMPLLQSKHVVIDVAAPSPPWFAIALTDGLPVVLMVAVLAWMGRRAAQAQSGLFGFGRNKARRYSEDHPKVTFADVAGVDEAKQDLAEVVDFLSHPAKYLQMGARIPRGVLLVGPPGTGKTLLARAVAGEAGVPFFSISGSEFVEMFVGVGASRVRDLFTQAKAAQPAIVFVDELDAVGRRRGAAGSANDEREQTLNQLLVEMDGFDERQQVILLAATNRPDVLDPALLRPGRFDREVVVPPPDRRGREGILRIHTRHLPLAEGVDLDRLARTATGLSGAELANLCNEAALGAARHNRDKVTMEDFEQAWDKIVLGAERSTVLTPHDRRVVAYHEGGHAVVAWLTPEADPVRKVTIVPHGRALGVTEQLPTDDRYNMSRAELLARLDVMLGGRTSEEIVIGEITTGAENDLVQATQLARRMITRWGMGSLGLVAYDSQNEQPYLGYPLAQGHEYSEATAAKIDTEVASLLAERHTAVHRLLGGARERLDLLAERLLKEETIGDAQLEEILGPRPSVPSAKVVTIR